MLESPQRVPHRSRPSKGDSCMPRPKSEVDDRIRRLEAALSALQRSKAALLKFGLNEAAAIRFAAKMLDMVVGPADLKNRGGRPPKGTAKKGDRRKRAKK